MLGRQQKPAENLEEFFRIKTNKMATDKEDAQIRILKRIQSEEVNKKWEGFAPDIKWKRGTISDVMILQELESVREENKTMQKQMSDLKREQSELVNLVRQMKDALDKKQGQNITKRETGEEKNQTNKGGKQKTQTRTANDWNGGKGGPKKPKHTGDPLPGSQEYAESKNDTDTNSNEEHWEERKIRRVKTVLNADGTDIEKIPYEIPRSKYKVRKIPDIERKRLKEKDEEEKSREVIFCGIPSPSSYVKDTPYETARQVMNACDELKTRYLRNHYGINVKTTDIAFAQRQLGHINKKFTTITARFRKKETAEKIIGAARFLNILNKRGTAKYGKYREPVDHVNEKDEVVKPPPEVVERYKERPGTFMKISRTLEQQASDRAARNHRETKAYKDREKVKVFQKEQRIAQIHFEALEIPEEETSSEEHDAEQYGIIPEPPEENDLSFNTAPEEDLTPDEKKETTGTGKSQTNKLK